MKKCKHGLTCDSCSLCLGYRQSNKGTTAGGGLFTHNQTLNHARFASIQREYNYWGHRNTLFRPPKGKGGKVVVEPVKIIKFNIGYINRRKEVSA